MDRQEIQPHRYFDECQPIRGSTILSLRVLELAVRVDPLWAQWVPVQAEWKIASLLDSCRRSCCIAKPSPSA